MSQATETKRCRKIGFNLLCQIKHRGILKLVFPRADS